MNEKQFNKLVSLIDTAQIIFWLKMVVAGLVVQILAQVAL